MAIKQDLPGVFGLNFSALFATLVCGTSLLSQVASPKHENRLHHLFASHRDSSNLQDRYSSLSCSLVLIQSGNRLGTGFYISSAGEVVTASHVLGDRTFSELPDGRMQVSLTNPATITEISMKDSRGSYTVPLAGVDTNADNWIFDLATIETNRHTDCWLRVGDDKRARPGQSVLTLGFPGLSFGSLTLYTGIVSAKLREDVLMGTTVQGHPLKPQNESLRVQMPISAGISGSPLIDDENHVLGVLTTAGISFPDLDKLIEAQHVKDAQPLVNLPAGVFDYGSAVGHLALVLREFASPGYGDAVPMSYLKQSPAPPPQTPASPAR